MKSKAARAFLLEIERVPEQLVTYRRVFLTQKHLLVNFFSSFVLCINSCFAQKTPFLKGVFKYIKGGAAINDKWYQQRVQRLEYRLNLFKNQGISVDCRGRTKSKYTLKVKLVVTLSYKQEPREALRYTYFW